MDQEAAFEKFRNCAVEVLQVPAEKVTREARFGDDLDADSLDLVELVMSFEEEFSIEIPDSDAEKQLTVGDVVKYIEQRVGA